MGRKAVVAVVLLLSVTGPLRANAAEKAAPRQPVPSAVAVAAANKTLEEVYGADLANPLAKARLRLALRMVEDAARTDDDPAGKYALLLKARELATDAAELQTAFDAINALAAAYAIDAAALGGETLEKIAPKLDTPDERTLLAGYGIYVLEQFAGENRYGELTRLYPLVQNAAARSASAETKARVALAIDHLRAASAEYQKATPAFDALARNADDPAANEAAGKFELVFGRNASDGLALLAKGPQSPGSWKALAVRDLANPDSADQQSALAEDWWTLAETQTGPARDRLEARSIHWYRRALPGLSGLARAAAEQRLAAAPAGGLPDEGGLPPRHEVAGAPPATPPPPARPPLRLVVVSARWGGGRNWVDVTNKVRQLFKDQSPFFANPSTLGADPTPGWRKRLEITCLKDGRRRRLIRDEDQKLDPVALDQ
jgi:hypothetical protein